MFQLLNMNCKFGLFWGLLSLVCCSQVKAQQDYENEIIGWENVFQNKPITKPTIANNRTYSIKQIALADSFIKWIQLSYTPKGALGRTKKIATSIRTEDGIDYSKPFPQYYGAQVNSFLFLKKTNNKWVAENNLGYFFFMVANYVPSEQILSGLSTDKDLFFTIREYDQQQMKAYPNSDEARNFKLYDLSTHTQLNKYITYAIPSRNNTDKQGNLVILSKNNRNPFVHVTIGDYLNAALLAVNHHYPIKRRNLEDQYKNDTRYLSTVLNRHDNEYAIAKETIEKLKQKYKSRLNEFAYTRYGGNGVNGLEYGRDPFTGRAVLEEGDFDVQYPIYRVDPQMLALTSKDNPQWVGIYWTGGFVDEPVYKHMHESILNNFDFDFLYNYVFDTAKIKGKYYKPLRSPVYVETALAVKASAATDKMAKDPSVLFFDDFSTRAIGKTPENWISKLNMEGKNVVITSLTGTTENWALIKGNASFSNSKIPSKIEGDFEFSFDIAAPKDIPWGTKAFEGFWGNRKNSNFKNNGFYFRIRPGFSGRAGLIRFESQFGTSNEFMKPELNAEGLSNDKQVNRAKFKIIRKGTLIQVFLNSGLLAEFPSTIPKEFTFDTLEFGQLNSDSELQQYYITNISIQKLK